MLGTRQRLKATPIYCRGSQMHKDRLLIVEDEREVCEVLRSYLESKGYEVLTAPSCAMAEQLWRTVRPDAAVLDYSLPDGTALELIPRLRAIDSSAPLIILTGYGSIELAVEAVKLGAEQFLVKPAELSTLRVLLQRSLENQRNRRTRMAEKNRTIRHVLDPFIGDSDAIRKVSALAYRIAGGDNPVLIQGETGTGKGVLARWLHENSPRASEAFVDLSCNSLTKEALEAELFGHGRPTSNGGQSKVGVLEIAHKGTLFLDEISEMDLAVQPNLLKILEQRQFRRVGETCDHRVDIRLIAATHQTLAHQVHQRRFRGDLYFRISTVSLTIPPLRDRVEDIPELSAHILNNLASDLGTSGYDLSDRAVRALQGYSWPGNIRELRNVLERAVLVAGDSLLTENDLHFDVLVEQNLVGAGHFRTLEEVERHYIEHVLRKEGGRVESAARKLGIPRSSLYHKLKQYRTSESGLSTAS